MFIHMKIWRVCVVKSMIIHLFIKQVSAGSLSMLVNAIMADLTSSAHMKMFSLMNLLCFYEARQ